MLNTVYDVDIPLSFCLTVYSALGSEAFESRSSYRNYVKGYISALRDLGATHDSLSTLYDAFMSFESEIDFDN